MLSVAANQLSETEVVVVPETAKLVGAVGACESAVGFQTACTYSG